MCRSNAPVAGPRQARSAFTRRQRAQAKPTPPSGNARVSRESPLGLHETPAPAQPTPRWGCFLGPKVLGRVAGP
eukprot:4098031-Lingulodinium_polyedra.AAC.1